MRYRWLSVLAFFAVTLAALGQQPPTPQPAGQLELSGDGKALNYFEVAPFALELTPAAIAEAAKTLPTRPET